MSIRIYYDDVGFRYKGWRNTRKLIEEILTAGKREAGEISYIITDDNKLRDINVEFLEHNYFTDVITFNYNSGNVVSGEIYISIDTVRENAKLYKVTVLNELTRVIIHGVLHLSGYDDKTEEEKSRMRYLEDLWLKKGGY